MCGMVQIWPNQGKQKELKSGFPLPIHAAGGVLIHPGLEKDGDGVLCI